MTYLRLSFLFFIPFFISCEKENADPSLTSTTELESLLAKGDWVITRFIDSGKDELYHFSPYTFRFEANGNLMASGENNVFQGSWSIDHGNSYDDSPDDVDFNIYFNLSNAFEELNDDWDIMNIEGNKIDLIDISGGNGGTDYLTFTRR